MLVMCLIIRSVYASCVVENTANVCQRNADCVTSAGQSIWCTGPKTGACYVYDRYLTRFLVEGFTVQYLNLIELIFIYPHKIIHQKIISNNVIL